MTRGTYSIGNRFLALILCIVMVAGLIPVSSIAADPSQTIGSDRIADPSTMNVWQDYFGPDINNTAYAGGVWMDKSVFKDTDAFSNVTTLPDGSAGQVTMGDDTFLIALSAIASNKEIYGYSTIPTDTMLVLDVTGSMLNQTAIGYRGNSWIYNKNTELIDAMVETTNDAITRLMELNKHNRVGVVLYSGNAQTGNSARSTAQILLPLGRYSGVSGEYLEMKTTQKTERIYVEGNRNNWVEQTTTWTDSVTVALKSGLKTEAGAAVAYADKEVIGGTYMQNGLFTAWEAFDDINDTTIAADQLQGGTKRTPIMVLMSDGMPTSASAQYYDLGESHLGNGQEPSGTTANQIDFVTQLTASWVRSQMKDKYDTEPFFYTLGLGSTSSILDPDTSSATLRTYWQKFLAGAEGQNVKIIDNNGNNNDWSLLRYDTPEGADMVRTYVDDYWYADDAQGLIDAFTMIIDEIVLQSKYYATLVTQGEHDIDGYITFEDELGEFMEVKEMTGLVIGDTLYSGLEMAKALDEGVLGTPGASHPLGDEFVWTVMERLGIDSVTEAQQLIASAYGAGQLAYDATAGTYSNYIGWYADENNNFLGHWEESHTEEDYPDASQYQTLYINRSYGFLGEHQDSNMMHIVVQVHTNVSNGHQRVVFKIPASLIPMVTYTINLTGDNVETATNITMTSNADTVSPMRLLFEVGLRDTINPLTVDSIVGGSDHYHKNTDGSYSFYSNRWGAHAGDDPEDFDYTNPTGHTTTVASFQPSHQNERYYFTEDEIVLDASGQPIAISAGLDPNNTYYYNRGIFKNTGNGDTAVYSNDLLPLAKEDIEDALANYASGDQYYVVPKGVINAPAQSYRLDKDDENTAINENLTNTLIYSNYAYIPNARGSEGNFGVYAYLGNNGTFTMAPATGLKLTKTVTEDIDATLFTFEISNVPDTYQLTNADGGALPSTVTSNYDAASDKLTVTMPKDVTVYLTGIPAGTVCKIAEVIPSGSDYSLDQILVDNADQTAAGEATVTIPAVTDAVKLVPVTFTNAPKGYGSIVVSKEVTHPYTTTMPGELVDMDFAITVTLTGDSANEAYYLDASGTKVYADNGKFELSLSHGEIVTILGIPEGVTYTVEETGLPTYIVNTTGTLTGTVEKDSVTNAHIVNNYNSAAPNETVTIKGEKSITVPAGGVPFDWSGKTFSFLVEEYFPATGTYNAIKTLTVDENDHTFSYTLPPFTKLGAYYFKISEVIPAEGAADRIDKMSYDATVGRIIVYVTDNDVNGQMEISIVNADTNTTDFITTDGVNFTFTKDFVNTYDVAATYVEIPISKIVVDPHNTGVSPAGFLFGLFADGATTPSYTMRTQLSGDIGIATFHVPVNKVGNSVYYLSEIVPENERLPGMDYSAAQYKITVTGTLSGGVLTADYTVEDASGNPVSKDAVSFTNTMALTSDSVRLSANKTLAGRDMVRAEDFKFTLTEMTDSTFSTAKGVPQEKTLRMQVLTDSNIYFDEISYSKVGTYYYVIKEVAGVNDGITYDAAEYRVTVTVAPHPTAASLVATTSITDANGVPVALDAVSFTNTYAISDTEELTLEGHKTLTGGTLHGGQFSFVLSDDNGEIETVSNHANGHFTFTTLTYDVADVGKTYNYTVAEVIPDEARENNNILNGFTYDPTVYNISVTITDDGNGGLSLEYNSSVAADKLDFINAYDAKDVTVDLGGKKHLDGRDLSNEFQFELVELAAEDDYDGDVVATVTNNGNNFIFPTLTYKYNGGVAGQTDIGMHYYLIREVNNGLGGVSYDDVLYRVNVSVTDPGNGKLTALVTYGQEGVVGNIGADDVVFNNTYTAQPTSTDLEGTKEIKDKLTGAVTKPTDGAYTFELYNALLVDAAYVKVGDRIAYDTNDADGNFTFEDIPLDTAGTHAFIVVENADNPIYDIVYDETEYVIMVEVLDDGNGNLYVKQNGVTVTGGSANNGITFTNTYDPTVNEKDNSLTVNLFKEIENSYAAVIGKDGYQFKLEGTDNSTNLTSAATGTDGKTSFTLDYTEQDIGKTYNYTISEVQGNKTDIVYSTKAHTLKVTVGVNGANLTLDATLDGVPVTDLDALNVTYTNIYDPKKTDKEIDVTVDISKVIENVYAAEVGKDGYKFQLTGKDNGTALTSDATGTDGKTGFTLSYTEQDIGKTYTYEVTEVNTGKADISYSTVKHTITVSVDVDAAGKLIAVAKQDSKVIDAPLSFTNTYDPTLTEKKVQVPVDVTKVLNNLSDEKAVLSGFEFKITDKASGNSATDKSDETGKAAFLLTYTEEHISNTYTYELVEVNGKVAGMTYDTTVHTFTVTVDVNAKGELIAKLTTDGKETEKLAATFTNTYAPEKAEEPEEKPIVTPPMGDEAQLTLWFTLMAVSAAAIAMLVLLGKKKRA